jgi:hypothetical protein
MNDILITAPLPDFLKQPLPPTPATTITARPTRPACWPVGTKIVGLVRGGSLAPVEMLDALPNLQIISVFGVGYDGVPVDYCRRRGIKVGHTPDVLTDDVADVALALTLTLSRQFHLANRYVQAGDWPRRPLPLSTSVTGKTVGILGLGRIGKAIARRLEACGMKVGYHGRAAQIRSVRLSDADRHGRGGRLPDRRLPRRPATKEHSERRSARGAGRPGQDHQHRARLDHRRGGDDQGAAGRNPRARAGCVRQRAACPRPGLLAMDNVVLFPHVGSATRGNRKAMGDLTLANLAAYFAGKPLVKLIPELQYPSPVSRES